MVNVLIADRLADSALEALTALGAEVTNQPGLSADDLSLAIQDFEVLVVRSTKVTRETLEQGRHLSLVVRAGAGVNTIDVASASGLGIHVANCPGTNAAAVAELTIGLLVAADRQIVNACRDLRAGKWLKKAYGHARGLRGRTLGLLGFGAIGQAVAAAAHGLGMHVKVWSRSLTDDVAERHGVERCVQPIDVADSDAVSIHLAATDQTRHMVDANFLAAMPTGAILLNTSRGPLVDTEALRQAIAERSLRVGLDVFEQEPSGGEAEFEDTALASMLTGTPHIGASTDQTSEAIAAEVVRIIREFATTGAVHHSVNLCDKADAAHTLVIRHYNRVGVLAGVLDGLREEQINVQQMENKIFDGKAAAVCTLSLDGCPSRELLDRLEAQDVILQVMLHETVATS
ncbi:MAG: NAD(P)-dependent oxidoreductase [Planctomycetota bacterium]